MVNDRREIEIAEAVSVVGEKRFFAAQIFFHRAKALSDIRFDARIRKGDFPVVNVAIGKLELAAAIGKHEVVGEALIVIQEILLNCVAAIAQAQNKIAMAEVRVVLHYVPDDRPRANRDERLGDCLRIVADAQALAAAKEDDFHGCSSFARNSFFREVEHAFCKLLIELWPWEWAPRTCRPILVYTRVAG